jgi:hypothetical protein
MLTVKPLPVKRTFFIDISSDIKEDSDFIKIRRSVSNLGGSVIKFHLYDSPTGNHVVEMVTFYDETEQKIKDHFEDDPLGSYLKGV